MRMWPPRAIVVAVDFSDASATACAVAARLADRLDAHVTVLHADRVDVPVYFTHEQLDLITREVRAARNAADTHLRRFAATCGLADAAALVVSAAPVDAILHASERADLVVVGSHGRHRAIRWWMGSVAQRVAGSVDVPVLVTPATIEVPSVDQLLARVVVVAGAGRDVAAGAADRIAALGPSAAVEEVSTEACDAETIGRASLVVVPLPFQNRERALHDASGLWTGRCRAPVLFMPEGAAAASSVA